MSGASCGPRRSTWRAASRGARARTPRSPPRRPRSSGSISPRPTRRWCWRSTRSRTEKPHIQALERAQGYLKLPNGRALTGHAHNYKRHGTSTLFAAFNIANGAVTARHYRRRRRIEFLDFMNRIVAAHPGREIHVILDNLNTHKPKRDRWLARHQTVHFHDTPTGASWLNQVECWFSILAGQSLQGASFTGVAELRRHIDAFIASYNETARPFAWSKSEVHQKRLKPRFAEL
jgi:transposase